MLKQFNDILILHKSFETTRNFDQLCGHSCKYALSSQDVLKKIRFNEEY